MARRCGAPLADDRLCGLSAGWGTEHTGFGRCRHHQDVPIEGAERRALTWGADWSASLCEAYMACPCRCYRGYAERRPGRQSHIFDDGRRFHHFAERYARHCYGLRDTPYGGRADRTYGYALASVSAPDPDDANLRQLLMGFVAAHEFDWGTVLATAERQIEAIYTADLPDGLGRFRGTPDVVAIDAEGVARITDWKTFWWAPSIIIDDPAELYDQPPPQLLTYAWLVGTRYPQVHTFVLEYHYVRKGHIATWEVGRAQVENCPYLPVVAEMADRIKRRLPWPASPGHAACDVCPYVHDCPDVADIVTADSAADAIALLAQAQRLQARANDLAAAARAYAKATGPLTLNDGTVVGYRDDTKLVVGDRDGFWDAIEDDGGYSLRTIAGQPTQETLEELLRGMGRVDDIERYIDIQPIPRWAPLNIPRGRASRLQLTDNAEEAPRDTDEAG